MITNGRKKYCNFRECFTKYIEDSQNECNMGMYSDFAKPNKT